MEGEERTPLISSAAPNRSIWSNCWTRLVPILIGQLLSILICSSAVTSVYLISFGVETPTFQNFIFYVILSIIFTTALALRSHPRDLITVLKSRGWQYFLLAFCDAEANFLMVKAYQYTTLTSVQLLDCFTIPTVLVLSRIFLGVRYKTGHIIAALVCFVGVCCLVWGDILVDLPLGEGGNRLLGDALCLLGAFLYGVSNVSQEYLVKTFDTVEFLGAIGLFGSVITGIQSILLESGELTVAIATNSPWPLLLLLGFAFTQLLFYIFAALLMKISGAGMYSLSCLTADFYSVFAGIFLFQYQLHSLYIISFLLILYGLTVFSLKPAHFTVPQSSSQLN